jgi:hypothetical protein
MSAADERQTDSDWLGVLLCRLAEVISVMPEVAGNGMMNQAVRDGAKYRLDSAAEIDDDGITKVRIKMVAVTKETATDVK